MLNKINRAFIHTSDFTRHWCPKSQRYAGGDALLTYLNDGWKIQQDIHYEAFWHGGSRRVIVYDIVLGRQDERVRMRVISNPVVDRLLTKWPVRILETKSAQQQMRTRQPAKSVH